MLTRITYLIKGYIYVNPHNTMIRIDSFNYYVNQYLKYINSFNMLFMLNISELIINYINLNNKINKQCRVIQSLIELCLNLLILTRLLFRVWVNKYSKIFLY